MLANVGQVPTSAIVVSIVAPNAYAITFTSAPHPYGNDFLVFAQPRTTSSTATLLVCVATHTSTSLKVWNRTTANANVTGAFYVYSVP